MCCKELFRFCAQVWTWNNLGSEITLLVDMLCATERRLSEKA